MSVTIRFIGGEKSGQSQKFGDGADVITIGRDPARCQVVFPPGETQVGREHCALRRELGRYRLVLNGDNRVFVDGKEADHDQRLENFTEIQLGKGGPKVAIEATGNDALPETIEDLGARDRVSKLQDVHHAARSGRKTAAIAVVLLLALGGVVWWAINKSQEQVKEIQEGMTQFEKNIEDQIVRVEEKVDQATPELSSILQEAGKSVYLVLKRTGSGGEFGGGTASVIGPGVLATNAHVAEQFNKLKAGEELWVRSTGDEPKAFKISRVEIHPGYGSLQKLWQEYLPVHGNVLSELQYVPQAGAACDVALMHVEGDAAALGEPLKLASPEQLRKLNAGTPVGYVGFPMENLSLEVTVKRPTPTVQISHITAVTTFFGTRVKDESPAIANHLVQHALPAAGGASGSPILTTDGVVVAYLNAGNMFIVSTEDNLKVRIPSAALVNYAQRADLMQELLDGAAASRQPDRDRAWQQQLQTLYTSAEQVKKTEYPKYLARDWTFFLTQRWTDWTLFDAAQVDHQTGMLAAGASEGDEATGSLELQIDKALPTLVIVYAKQKLVMSKLDDASASRPIEIDGRYVNNKRSEQFRYATFTPRAPVKATLEVTGGEAGAPFEVFVYQAEQKTASSQEVRDGFVDFLLYFLEINRRGRYATRPVASLSGQVDTAAGGGRVMRDIKDLSLPAGGSYLVVAMSEDKRPLEVGVYSHDGSSRIAANQADSGLANCLFTIEAKSSLKAVVLADRGVKYELTAYQLIEKQ